MVRGGEIGSLDAAELALSGLEAASSGLPIRAPGAELGGGPDRVSAQVQGTNLPALPAAPAVAAAWGAKGSLALPPEDWFESSVPAPGVSGAGRIEPAAPAQTAPIAQPAPAAQANLRVGPWADGGLGLGTGAGVPARQLSSYEIDPRLVRVQPWLAETAAGTVAGTVAEKAALDWRRFDRLGSKEGDQLAREIPLLFAPVPVEPQPAPIGLRFAAVLVDGALTLAAVVAATLAVTLNLKELPGIGEMALGAAAVLAVLGVLYQLVFLTLGEATPGMKCAHVALRTFEDEKTTRAQRFGRLGALFLALLPAGLGVWWAIFDRNHLSIHDRLSGTYMRKD